MGYKELVKRFETERDLVKKDGIITSEEIKKICKEKPINLDYNSAIRYLLPNKYLVRILRGIFYIKTIEERKKKITKINYFDAIVKALKIKNIDKWYFALETALKLNNLTHETFLIDTIINNKIRNTNPVKILGHKTKITKIGGIDFSFGIKKSLTKDKEEYFYSDPEKTLLDMAYIGKYNRETNEEIKNKISGYKHDKNKLKKYLKHYPKTMEELF